MLPKKQYYENTAKTIIANLEKRQMKGWYCEDSASAVKKVLELLPDQTTVTWGGAMTIEECGLMEALKKGDYTLIDLFSSKGSQERKALYAKAVSSDYFFMSTNAITLDGELVNVDGSGNRVACLCNGPDHVIILAGMNKVAATIQEAHDRVRNTAAPINALRLNRKTPCAATGKCSNCQSPECICSQIVITRRSHVPGRIQVILIGEELGY